MRGRGRHKPGSRHELALPATLPCSWTGPCWPCRACMMARQRACHSGRPPDKRCRPAATCAGPASARPDGAARVLFAPNSTEVRDLMLLVAKAAACPPDAARPRRSSSTSFYRHWWASAAAAAEAHPECLAGGAEACRAQPACYLPLFERQLEGHASGEAAEAAAAADPGTVDAVLDFSAWQQAGGSGPQLGGAWQEGLQGRQGRQQQQQQQWQQQARQQQQGQGPQLQGGALSFAYTLRMNHSEVPPTRMRLNQVNPKRGLG